MTASSRYREYFVAVSANPPVTTGRFSWERRLATTPGRMQMATVAAVVGMLLLGVVGTATLRARQRATAAAGRQAEPLLLGAEAIYSSLADANATAANAFLTPGLEPPDRRLEYQNDIAVAGTRLATVARQAGASPEAGKAITTITQDLPVYTGLVEAARADNRAGLPVGAAYLRESSTLMQAEILPAVGQLYRLAASRLDRAHASGRSLLDTGGVLVATGVAIAVLIVTQLFLTRRTNRLLNLPLAAATGLTLLLVIWTMAAFSAEAGRLADARRLGSDPVQLMSSARILVSRAVRDENLALVARGSGPQYLDDLNAVTAELGPADTSTGLMREAVLADNPPHRADPSDPLLGTGGLYASFLASHQQVLDAVNSLQFAKALQLATGRAPTDEFPVAARLTAALSGRIDAAQHRFDTEARAAGDDLGHLGLGVAGLAILAGILAVVGLQQRINEYR